jgi:hypothetical protein
MRMPSQHTRLFSIRISNQNLLLKKPTVRKTPVINTSVEDFDIHESSFFHQPFLIVCHHDRGRVFFVPCGVELVELPLDVYWGAYLPKI